jgi:hypothetical protein
MKMSDECSENENAANGASEQADRRASKAEKPQQVMNQTKRV